MPTLLTLLSLACAWAASTLADNTERQTLYSTTGEIVLRVPAEMKPQFDLNSEATIQAADPVQEIYVLVISEPKRDFPPGVSLTKYREAALDNIAKSTKAIKLGDAVQLKIHGHDAVQTSLTATVPGIDPRITYLLTTIDSEQAFHQVLAWTLESLADKNLPEMKAITASFEADLTAIRSSDGGWQLTLPEGMKATDQLNIDAQLQAADPDTERYVILISERKSDFPAETTLTSFFDGVVANMKSSTQEAEVGPTEKISIQGKSAMRTQLTAKVEGVDPKVTYLITAVETDGAFNNILCWSTADDFAKHQASLRLTADSLRAREPVKTPPRQ